MEIIIKTGFEKITHKIVFEPETIPKGKLLVKANHVCSVEEHRKNNKTYPTYPIYYINNEESLSKTDVKQQWGKPTTHQLAQEKYSKGKYFYEMFRPKNKLNL